MYESRSAGAGAAERLKYSTRSRSSSLTFGVINNFDLRRYSTLFDGNKGSSGTIRLGSMRRASSRSFGESSRKHIASTPIFNCLARSVIASYFGRHDASNRTNDSSDSNISVRSANGLRATSASFLLTTASGIPRSVMSRSSRCNSMNGRPVPSGSRSSPSGPTSPTSPPHIVSSRSIAIARTAGRSSRAITEANSNPTAVAASG